MSGSSGCFHLWMSGQFLDSTASATVHCYPSGGPERCCRAVSTAPDRTLFTSTSEAEETGRSIRRVADSTVDSGQISAVPDLGVHKNPSHRHCHVGCRARNHTHTVRYWRPVNATGHRPGPQTHPMHTRNPVPARKSNGVSGIAISSVTLPLVGHPEPPSMRSVVFPWEPPSIDDGKCRETGIVATCAVDLLRKKAGGRLAKKRMAMVCQMLYGADGRLSGANLR